jgi:hypothetical protein
MVTAEPFIASGESAPPVGKFVIQKNDRVTNMKLGVHDGLAIRCYRTRKLFGAESFLVKFDRGIRIAYN